MGFVRGKRLAGVEGVRRAHETRGGAREGGLNAPRGAIEGRPPAVALPAPPNRGSPPPGGYKGRVQRVKVRPDAGNVLALTAAEAVLRAGRIVAFPTETVYGLCVNALDKHAVRRLYTAKGREASKASALLLADRAAAEALVGPLPRLAARIADRFWPGPVTLVVPSRRGNPMGLRCPSYAFAQQLAREMPFPLLQTSANPSGQPAALNGAAVVRYLDGKVDLLLDGGTTEGGRSSTVVLCDHRRISIAREGAVPAAAILDAVVEPVVVACTGNICRSPVAEAMLRTMLAARLGTPEAGLGHFGFQVASFGTMGLTGREASEYAIIAAEEAGYDIRAHRARPFSIELAKSARVLYGLDQSHIDFLRPYFHTRPDDLRLLDPGGKEILDPYGKKLSYYRHAVEAMKRACEARVAELVAGIRKEGGPGEGDAA